MLGYVDERPTVEPRNGHLLLTFKSGGETVQLILTRHATIALELQCKGGLAMLAVEEMDAEPTPFRRKRARS